MVTKERTLEILNSFYESNLKFWEREITPELIAEGYPVERLAYMDTAKIKHDPYSPNGVRLDEETKLAWVKEKVKEIKQLLVAC